MPLKEKIEAYIKNNPGATDGELECALHKTHQTVNQACRSLEKQGVLLRRPNSEKRGLIGNYPTDAELPEKQKAPLPIPAVAEKEPLQEEQIKQILYEKLVLNGWTVKTAWGHTQGIDLDAGKNGKRWIIEVKGPGSRQPMRVNYFIGILGETLQRMNDPAARYSIALPDMAQYRRLWEKLPRLTKQRTTIDLLLISADGKIEVLK